MMTFLQSAEQKTVLNAPYPQGKKVSLLGIVLTCHRKRFSEQTVEKL